MHIHKIPSFICLKSVLKSDALTIYILYIENKSLHSYKTKVSPNFLTSSWLHNMFLPTLLCSRTKFTVFKKKLLVIEFCIILIHISAHATITAHIHTLVVTLLLEQC